MAYLLNMLEKYKLNGCGYLDLYHNAYIFLFWKSQQEIKAAPGWALTAM